MLLSLTADRAEKQRVYWAPWPIHWSRSHTKHFNWARYNNGSLHNVGISWGACQPVYGNSNIFDWKIFSATEYFAFCFLQEILIWLVVIYFLFHIFFLAANRLSIDTGTIHPHCLVKVSQHCYPPIIGQNVRPLTNQWTEREWAFLQLLQTMRWWKWEIVCGCQTAVGLTSINWWLRGRDCAIISIQRTFSSATYHHHHNPLALLFQWPSYIYPSSTEEKNIWDIMCLCCGRFRWVSKTISGWP